MTEDEFVTIPRRAIDRLFCPLCDEAQFLIYRLGVMNDQGETDDEQLTAMARIFGVSLYENLIAAGENIEDLLDNMDELFENGDVQGFYLYLCLLYGLTGEEIPEQIQWLANDKDILFCFLGELMDFLSQMNDEDDLSNGESRLHFNGTPCDIPSANTSPPVDSKVKLFDQNN